MIHMASGPDSHLFAAPLLIPRHAGLVLNY